ncbi:MAG: hypothetical protein HY721_12125, partial [Planctomycetes bacterium]|nr:hypothetical protein [Planctomycetota bacterium]
GPLAELGAFRGRLDVVQEMLFRRDYAAAEAAARALAAETANGPISAHDRALQLEAKARAFRRLLGSATPGPAQGSGGQGAPRKEKTLVAEVLLANGTRFEAKLLEERADAYVFRLFNGGRFAPRKEDVLEVRQVEREVALGADWTELQPKIAALSHPIDIFVDGVQRLLRLGLERQGLEILEKLLERPDSDQVPLLFVGDSDEGLLRDWQVAAGRRRPAGTAPDEVASAGEPPGARSDEGASAPAGTAAEADLASLTQARRLAEEAQALSQGAAGKEG